MVAEPTCARTRKIAEENGEQILRKENKKKKKRLLCPSPRKILLFHKISMEALRDEFAVLPLPLETLVILVQNPF